MTLAFLGLGVFGPAGAYRLSLLFQPHLHQSSVRKALRGLERLGLSKAAPAGPGRRTYELTENGLWLFFVRIVEAPWQMRIFLENNPAAGAAGTSLAGFNRLAERVGEKRALRLLKGRAKFFLRVVSSQEDYDRWERILQNNLDIVRHLIPIFEEFA